MADFSRQPEIVPAATSRDGEMELFTLRAPWWMLRIRQQNPLLRLSDRIEALSLVVLALVVALAVPVAGAVAIATTEHDAAGQAVIAALTWGAAAVLAGSTHLTVRAMCRRRHSRQWQRGFERLVEKTSS